MFGLDLPCAARPYAVCVHVCVHLDMHQMCIRTHARTQALTHARTHARARARAHTHTHTYRFQFSFAATAATIDSGAVAERMNFKPYLIYSTLMTGIYQPIVSHWCWDPNGWLTKMGFHDFAGCGPVHVIGGISALASAWLIGPRTGRFAKKGVIGVLNIEVIQGENLNSNDRVTSPYVVVQQLNHGDAECRCPSSQNCTNPRWGAMIKLEVYRDLDEEAEIQKDLEMQGMLELRFVQNHRVEQVAEFVD